MSTLHPRRRPIFNRRRGLTPILRAVTVAGAILGIGGAGFAAGLKMSQAKEPAAVAKPVMAAQIAP
jgi:hypothetical protein